MNTSLGTVALPAVTLESLQIEVYSNEDPTATDPVFALTDEGTVVASDATYSTGSWVGSYGADGWTVARTPTFGSGGDITLTASTRKWVWAKCVAGGETAVWRVGLIVVS